MAATGEHNRHTGGTDLVHPAPPGGSAALREHLPGLEPERHVNDWGRSELVEDVLDRTLYDFLYRYWFRVEADGVGNVPREGPVLLVANHGAAPPLTAAIIAKALRPSQGIGRPVHFAVERALGAVPGLDMMLVKAGAVTAHPANLHRLLFDEHQIVLVFPEAGAGRRRRDRSAVEPFHRIELLRAAVRTRATVVPVAVLGPEETVPIIRRLPLARRLPRPPLTGRLPLPGKTRLRFLGGAEPPRGPEVEVAQALGDELRGSIEETLAELAGARPAE